MKGSGTSLKYLLLAVLAIVGCAAVYALVFSRETTKDRVSQPQASGSSELHFSPDTDLEARDVQILDSAKSSVDIAMYAFTDHRIADELERLAQKGVKIRLYRDNEQWSEENSRAAQTGTKSTSEELNNLSNLEIRVKGRSLSMHMKAYCVDGKLLREGSANWSEAGEQKQDNDVYVLQDSVQVDDFEREFDLLWNRSDNKRP